MPESNEKFQFTFDGKTIEAKRGQTIAGALHAISQGAQIVRVHDAGETSQAIKVWQAIRGDNAGN